MGARESLQRLADKKQQEIENLRDQLERTEVYLQAVLDSIKLLPKEVNGSGAGEQPTLRPGTSLAKARDAIVSAGKPMHVNDLVKAIGKPDTKQNRISLSGSIAWYVRRGQVFTRPAPNTYGLIEMADVGALEESGIPNLPETFGGRD